MSKTESFNKQQQLGSQTAKGGFANEHDIVDKFNNYANDTEATQWLAMMGYDVALYDGVRCCFN